MFNHTQPSTTNIIAISPANVLTCPPGLRFWSFSNSQLQNDRQTQLDTPNNNPYPQNSLESILLPNKQRNKNEEETIHSPSAYLLNSVSPSISSTTDILIVLYQFSPPSQSQIYYALTSMNEDKMIFVKHSHLLNCINQSLPTHRQSSF